MIISSKKEKLFLFIGDIFIFVLSLWLSIFLRNGDVPSWVILKDHIVPFIFIFISWIVVFFIAGLYDKYTTILKDSMPEIILNTQIVNSGIAIAFFYLLPYFGITPKTILFLDLIISFVFVYIWRIYYHSVLGLRRKESAIIIGRGIEMQNLVKEINGNPRSQLNFILSIDLDKEKDNDYIQNVIEQIKINKINIIVIDLRNKSIEPILSVLYTQIFNGVRFINMEDIYEDVFDRVPLSFLKHDWFLENISLRYNFAYIFLKRFFDIVVSIFILFILAIIYPFVAIAIMIETKNKKILFSQKRIGESGKEIKIYKFLTMLIDDEGDENLKKENRLTSVGKFLRKTRIDELPQAWNVIKGDLSLVGPRPEMPLFVEIYNKEIPYYSIRHIIRPGLSGWAQICQENPPKGGVNFDDTKIKLSYDLYYLKNKSIMLDLNISLKTLKTLLSRKGK